VSVELRFDWYVSRSPDCAIYNLTGSCVHIALGSLGIRVDPEGRRSIAVQMTVLRPWLTRSLIPHSADDAYRCDRGEWL